ncbi:MAG: hypothetical protein ACE5JM_12485, partial [Armatimonadota bacterium]
MSAEVRESSRERILAREKENIMKQALDSLGCTRALLIAAACMLLLACAAAMAGAEALPCQATGIKIGEVTDTSAIVWTRLTRKPERNSGDLPMVSFTYEEDED